MTRIPRSSTPATKRRAPALAPDDRRQMIVDAVAPLLAQHGPDLSSKQIADAVGVAEGTLFRAFGDKDSLLRAAAERYLEEATGLPELRAIDPAWPLEVKLARVMGFMRSRFQGAFRVMSALGGSDPRARRSSDGEMSRLVDALFAADAVRLTVPPRRIMHTIRLLAFATSVPDIAGLEPPLTDDEVAGLLIHGIARPASDADVVEGAGS